MIPTLGTRPTLFETIAAVLAQTRPPREVIIALPPEVELAAPVGTRVVRAGRASSSAQRNAGARAATSAIVFFFDDDMLPEPDYAAVVCHVWETWGDRVIGVVGTLSNPPQQGEPLRRLVRAVGWQSHTAYFSRATRVMASGSYAHVPQPRTTVSVGFATGQCCSYRRNLIRREAFSEEFEGYVMGEDLDFSCRARRHGIIVQTPLALAFHNEGVSTGGERPQQVYHEAMPLAIFQWRHKAPGRRGRFAWKWSHATRSLFNLVMVLWTRDPAKYRAYRRGLRDARSYLASQAAGAADGRRPA